MYTLPFLPLLTEQLEQGMLGLGWGGGGKKEEKRKSNQAYQSSACCQWFMIDHTLFSEGEAGGCLRIMDNVIMDNVYMNCQR